MSKFDTRGDPSQLLKSINPSEAGLLDAAAKCHIRFRLGGDVSSSNNLLRNFLP